MFIIRIKVDRWLDVNIEGLSSPELVHNSRAHTSRLFFLLLCALTFGITVNSSKRGKKKATTYNWSSSSSAITRAHARHSVVGCLNNFEARGVGYIDHLSMQC